MERKLTAVVLSALVVASALGVGTAAAIGGSFDRAAGNAADDATDRAPNTGTDETDDGGPDGATGDDTADATGNESADSNGDGSASVSVSGSGQVSAQPDRAVVYVAVTAEAGGASEAASRLASNATRLRDALDGDDLPVESVRTVDYQISQAREEPPVQTRANGPTYVARQSFAVTITDPDAAGDVIDAAVGNGATEVTGVEFTLSEERRQELREEAIDDAVADARDQAEAAASSAGLELAGVRSVSVGDGGFAPVTERAVADDGTTIDASPVSVSASVQVTYGATGG